MTILYDYMTINQRKYFDSYIDNYIESCKNDKF